MVRAAEAYSYLEAKYKRQLVSLPSTPVVLNTTFRKLQCPFIDRPSQKK